jgi:DNA-binding transcriptional ArsR family regulator
MAATSEEQDMPTDLTAWIGGRRRIILQALRFHGGEANTSEVREYTGLPRGSFDHHINALLDPPGHLRIDGDPLDGEGLIEVTDRVDIGTPVPARQFGLTEVGEEVFGDVVDDVGVQASDVRNLQQRVAELEAENQDLKERFTQLRNYVEEVTTDA